MEKSNFRRIKIARRYRQPLAINALTEIAAAQSKASTTLSSSRKEKPQIKERSVNLVEISAFI
jgi:hypothetical protein